MFGYTGFYPQVSISHADETPERKALREAQEAARAQGDRAVRLCGTGDRAGQHIADQLKWLSTPGWPGDIGAMRAYTESFRRLLDWAEAGKPQQAGEAA